ncbi:MAG: aminomethyltransferase family protein [Acidobacteria bacterium]|nr:aminomethyltransferase family protein [Acidobacteriota bacterium]
MSEAVESLKVEGAARSSPLEPAHLRAGASMRAEDGARVPAHYGDARAEYEAVRGGVGAGLFDLSSRGRVEVSGAEAVQFLNGLVTNDVKTLAPGAWMGAAFPNVQGRLLAHARVMRADEEQRFLIDTEAATAGAVRAGLERFTLAGDFRVRDLGAEAALLSVQGAAAAALVGRVLGEAAAGVGRGRVSVVDWRGPQAVTVARATHTGEDGFDLFAAADSAGDLWDALVAAGARPAGRDALELLRVEAGVPRHGIDVTDANVVLEAGLDDSVSYTKGCYVGQEIIARIHWRGHVAKRLAGLRLEGEAAPGAKIKTADGAREIGRVTSAVLSPRLGRRIALGLLKYDFLQPGTELIVAGEAGETRARVAPLPFVRGSWDAGGDGAEPQS